MRKREKEYVLIINHSCSKWLKRETRRIDNKRMKNKIHAYICIYAYCFKSFYQCLREVAILTLRFILYFIES